MIGREGQKNLARSTVLVLGCGALGSTQAELLARAGVGRLILVDRDVLELHNLQRQFLYDEKDAQERMPKAVAAVRRLRSINSEIEVDAVVTDVTATNIAELIRPADLVLDGTDNFETRFILNDASIETGKPWVYGGVIGSEGTVLAVRPGLGPCLRCIFPDLPDAHHVPTCETHGVLNTAVVWVAALQVTEAIKVLVGIPSTEFRISSLDVWRGTAHSMVVSRAQSCICCGERRFEFLNGEHGSSSTVFCGRNAVQITPENKTVPDFKRLREELSPFGKVTVSGMLLEFCVDEHRLLVFPDGRMLVMGTNDVARAKCLVARYMGM